MNSDTLQGSTIVITGVTGQVARPLAMALARDNDVIGAARFTDAAARTNSRPLGSTACRSTSCQGDVSGPPADAEYVLNFAVAKTNDWETDLAANSGGLAYLMEHHRAARAFLHCSSTAVYKPEGHRVFEEDGPLGDNHGVWPFLRTYSICKIAAEGTARWAARAIRVADDDRPPLGAVRRRRRLARHPPAHDAAARPSRSTSTPRASTTPCTPTTSWPWCPACSLRLRCRPPRSTGAAASRSALRNGAPTWPSSPVPRPGSRRRGQTIDSVEIDTTRMHELAGQTSVPWRDGMARMAMALHPDKVQ